MSEIESSYSLLHNDVKEWIYSQKWKELREAQVEAIKAIRESDKNLIISAPTASGKTEAAFLPLISELLDSKKKEEIILYISPLKALINDQKDRLINITRKMYIDIIPWHGDISSNTKSKLFEAKKCILLITPESIEAMLVNNPLSARKIFKNTKAIVIDEFHSFIGNDRGEQLFSIIFRLEKYSKNQPRKIALSATLGEYEKVSKVLLNNKKDSIKYIDSSIGSSFKIRISLKGYEYDNSKIDSDSYTDNVAFKLEHNHPDCSIIKDINRFRDQTNLVFPNYRNSVEDFTFMGNFLSKELGQKEVYHAHHSLLATDIRLNIEKKARKGEEPMTIICTSTLEMGIDIGSADNVFQIGKPFSVSSLRQRLGRSGRRGSSPILRIFIVEDSNSEHDLFENLLREKLIQTIASVSLIGKGWYETPEKSGMSLCTISHQIISLISQLGSAMAAQIWAYFSNKIEYQLTKEDFKRILINLGELDLVIQTESFNLYLSEKGESLINNYDFYSSFVTPEEYRVFGNGRKIGLLPLSSMISEGDHIALSGKNWQILNIDNESKSISVVPSMVKGFLPGGTGQPNTHTKVIQEMRKIYNSNSIPDYLDSGAKELLRQARKTYLELNLANKNILGDKEDIVTWFPWVGGRTSLAICLLIEFFSEEKPFLSKLSIRCNYTSIIRTKEFIKPLDQSQIYNELFNLIIKNESKFSFPNGKWSWLLPNDLKIKDFMNRELNIQEAISIINDFQD